MSNQHEFSLDDSATLGDLSAWMKIVAIGGVVLGAVTVVGAAIAITKAAAIGNILNLGSGALWIVVGVWLWGAGGAMKSVTVTEGNDMVHFMTALKSMSKVYMVQAISVIINALILLSVLLV